MTHVATWSQKPKPLSMPDIGHVASHGTHPPPVLPNLLKPRHEKTQKRDLSKPDASLGLRPSLVIDKPRRRISKVATAVGPKTTSVHSNTGGSGLETGSGKDSPLQNLDTVAACLRSEYCSPAPICLAVQQGTSNTETQPTPAPGCPAAPVRQPEIQTNSNKPGKLPDCPLTSTSRDCEPQHGRSISG